MAQKPILFSTEMVRAILDGCKSQTRRIIKPQPYETEMCPVIVCTDVQSPSGYTFASDRFGDRHIKAKYQVGDTLWVRETFWLRNHGNTYRGLGIDYKAGGHSKHILKPKGVTGLCKWKSSRFMPKYAARIFLEITNIRVERVQDISEEDANKEGIPDAYGILKPIVGFARLWDSINIKRGYGWTENPFVWCISFKRVKKCQN